jgi:hypothetical protein
VLPQVYFTDPQQLPQGLSTGVIYRPPGASPGLIYRPPTASPGAFYRLPGANSQQLPGDSKSPGLVRIVRSLAIIISLDRVMSA